VSDLVGLKVGALIRIYRGSHIHVACRSVCDRDQASWIGKNRPWSLDRSVPRLLVADSTGVQRTKCSYACYNYLRNCVDRLILVAQIPWSAR